MPCRVADQSSYLRIAPVGELTAEQIVQIVREHYPTLGNRGVLWDLTAADWSSMSHTDFVAIAASTFRARAFNPTGRTAYLVADEVNYRRMWRYLNQAFKFGVPAEYNVFWTHAEAEGWLNG